MIPIQNATLLNHTCGFYCSPERHAFEAMAIPVYTADDVRACYDGYLASAGLHVVDVRLAPEADRNTWKKKMGWHWSEGLKRYVRGPGDVPDNAVCWLVIIERVEHEDG